MKRDRGMQIDEAGKALTPEQLAELLAIRWMTIVAPETRTPIMREYVMDEVHGPLTRKRILSWSTVPGWAKSKWRLPTLTQFGELVLLSRLRDAVEHLLPKYEEEPE